MMQTYANLSILAAFTAYCFTDAKFVGKAAKVLVFVGIGAFVVTEAMALFA